MNVLASEVGERATSPPESTSQRAQTAHDNVPTHLCLTQSKIQQTKHVNTGVLQSQNAREGDIEVNVEKRDKRREMDEWRLSSLFAHSLYSVNSSLD